AGQFAPGQTEGEHLLAHELAHTVQQDGATGAGDASDGGALEHEASRAADAAVGGGRAAIGPAARAPGLQRDQKPGAGANVDRVEARAALRAYLVEQREKQGGKKLIVTPAVVLGLGTFFNADPSARATAMMYVHSQLDQQVELDSFAAKVADFLPAAVPAADTRPKPIGPKLDTSSPPGLISKVAGAFDRSKAADPRPEEQVAQWKWDFEVGETTKSGGAKGPIKGIPGLITFPALDPFLIARVIGELKKEPAAAAPVAGDQSAVEKLATSVDATLLVPAEAKASGAGSGSWAQAPDVVRSIGRDLELAHRKNNSTIELRLGPSYLGAKDRLAVIAELRRLVKQVRDALPTRPTKVDAVIIYFGDQQVQRVGLWGGD
ncbi:MAG TPA: DUF4157 domain-containing protein, partial [Kofleriaceae bacterium]|nr:DUF4157 domain-containing protein [Kofleriaceae bacterium]